MMNGDAVKELATRFRGPVILSTGDIAVPNEWKVVHPSTIVGPKAEALSVYTLHALCDYLTANRDKLPIADLVVHVVSPVLVRLLGPLHEVSRARETYVEAKALDLTDRFLGEFLTLEEAIVGLQTRCVPGPDRDEVQRLLSNIETAAVQVSTDDGISQTVTAKVGITKRQDVTVPNPVTLQPYRSFREVTQPAVPFVVRMEGREVGQARVAFHEADGGAWRVGAVNAIVAWLKDHVAVVDGPVAILG